jgi:hypothetical protein
MFNLLKLLQWRMPASLVSRGDLGTTDDPSAVRGGWASRRAAPVDQDRVLTSDTHYWLHTVPSGLHPKRTCRLFPRIANRLSRIWDDPQQTETAFDELLFDRRGDRGGFPPAIVSEISRLRGYHRRRWRELDQKSWQR